MYKQILVLGISLISAVFAGSLKLTSCSSSAFKDVSVEISVCDKTGCNFRSGHPFSIYFVLTSTTTLQSLSVSLSVPQFSSDAIITKDLCEMGPCPLSGTGKYSVTETITIPAEYEFILPQKNIKIKLEVFDPANPSNILYCGTTSVNLCPSAGCSGKGGKVLGVLGRK
ncbi:uncharacterized protein LOC132259792 [Phlebotomus argentipes]|uniref:uncharacterized protein LOC132259792 n=1 Tax=Phlebotomus argentipes TaxID=94469 RepID=UPI002892AC41|nr:uncharacterized protein LOC132259792 [Phlebotomus argentipes]